MSGDTLFIGELSSIIALIMTQAIVAQKKLLEQLREIGVGLAATQDALENDKDIIKAHRYLQALERDLDKATVLLARWEIARSPRLCKLWNRVKKSLHPLNSDQ